MGRGLLAGPDAALHASSCPQEFVQIYQTSSGAGKTVLLFFMDKETGVAVQEKYRCMVLSNSITEADMGRVLVLHEDELHGVKVTVSTSMHITALQLGRPECWLTDIPPRLHLISPRFHQPRPVLRCRGCQHGHGVDDLIARHGLLPFDLMSREMRRLEEQLRSKQVPGARRWAQQAVVAMQGDEDEAVRWVQIEYKKQGPWPPQVSCGVKECKTVLECMELSFWLDEEVRKALSTEEAMRDQAAAADGQGQEEEAADMVPPYRPPMSPKSRLRGQYGLPCPVCLSGSGGPADMDELMFCFLFVVVCFLFVVVASRHEAAAHRGARRTEGGA